MLLLAVNVQTQVSFDSLQHGKYDGGYCESIAQLQQTQWGKNKIKEPINGNCLKTGKTFRSKLMPISVMIKPNESDKFGHYSGTK